MEPISVCNHTSDLQNQTTAKRESDLSITSVITDRIGRHEVLLPINHNHYNFWKKKKHWGETSPVETMSKAKNLEISQFTCQVVAMVIVIDSVIGGFSWVNLVWLAASTVRLQVSDYSQLSDYNCTGWFAADVPIHLRELWRLWLR